MWLQVEDVKWRRWWWYENYIIINLVTKWRFKKKWVESCQLVGETKCITTSFTSHITCEYKRLEFCYFPCGKLSYYHELLRCRISSFTHQSSMIVYVLCSNYTPGLTRISHYYYCYLKHTRWMASGCGSNGNAACGGRFCIPGNNTQGQTQPIFVVRIFFNSYNSYIVLVLHLKANLTTNNGAGIIDLLINYHRFQRVTWAPLR